MPAAIGSTLTAFGNLYEQVQEISASVSVDITAYLDASVTGYLDASLSTYIDASVTTYLDASVTGFTNAYLDASVTAYLDASVSEYINASVSAYMDASMTAYLDASMTAYLDASMTAYLDASMTDYIDTTITDLAAAAFAGFSSDLVASITTISYSLSDMTTSLSDISTSLTTLGAGGPQLYLLHTSAQSIVDSFSTLAGTSADPAVIHMYVDTSFTTVSITTEPTSSGYSLAVLSLGSSLSVHVPNGAVMLEYFLQSSEPASLLWNAENWYLLPGLYPNNSLASYSDGAPL